MKITTGNPNNGIHRMLLINFLDLDFADDLALLAHNHKQMPDKTNHLEVTSARTGFKIKEKKIKIMKINARFNTTITISGEPIEEVESFISFYLGRVIDLKDGTDQDVKLARQGGGRFHYAKKISAYSEINADTKLKIFNTNVKSVLLDGRKTWRTTESL
ncbi:hypothetical protein ElyMa_002458500 [Elysia marginata]|uniref:DUF6451 domain-containing protein n=1 Tax=Elysia marginata TaxID=1093978 RepID=A0AAV4GM04_9GAST|nr:hypothetical protein ElyMa_002458500 [Elysia marginata]